MTVPGVPRAARTRIKICGITQVEHAIAAADAGADAIGLVSVTRSPRLIDPPTMDAILAALPPLLTPIALFQDPTAGQVRDQWSGEWIQLHGDEEESLIRELPYRIIKGFRFTPEAVARWNACSYVDALLIDGSTGGGGQSFDHHELAAMRAEIDKPVILAGGLTPENVGEAIRIVRPYAVDVSSGVETSRGIKDPERIHAFCAAVWAADHG